MFTQANLFLILLLAIALIAKNQSLLFAVSVLLIIKIVGLDQKLFPTIQSKGILLPSPFLSRLPREKSDLSSLEKQCGLPTHGSPLERGSQWR